MNEITELENFLNSMKETLPFEDMEDFREKIKTQKDFRIRVQKLVYISKFFGWENNYHFNYHEHGPYSCELANDYQKLNELTSESNSTNLNMESFKKFIKDQTNASLEATSTILYYIDKTDLSADEDSIMEIISYLKPHLPKQVIKTSFEKINDFGLHTPFQLKNRPDFLSKEIVVDKLNGLIAIFENFENCSNRMLLLGSMDYFRLSLKRENLEYHQKNELLNVVYDYGEYLEKYYFINYSITDDFPYHDLTPIDTKFNELQYYISDLGILPRLYDDNVNLNVFLE